MWNVGVRTFLWWAHFSPRRLTSPLPSSWRTSGCDSYRSKYWDRDNNTSLTNSGSDIAILGVGPNQIRNVGPEMES
jgi:hypothetical protein